MFFSFSFFFLNTPPQFFSLLAFFIFLSSLHSAFLLIFFFPLLLYFSFLQVLTFISFIFLSVLSYFILFSFSLFLMFLMFFFFCFVVLFNFLLLSLYIFSFFFQNLLILYILLRAILNKSWRQYPTKHPLYDHQPPITKTIKVRRTRHAEHYWRSMDELISDVPLWISSHDQAKARRPTRTYIQQLCEDKGCSPEDLPEAMNDKEEWRERVRDIHAGGTR